MVSLVLVHIAKKLVVAQGALGLCVRPHFRLPPRPHQPTPRHAASCCGRWTRRRGIRQRSWGPKRWTGAEYGSANRCSKQIGKIPLRGQRTAGRDLLLLLSSSSYFSDRVYAACCGYSLWRGYWDGGPNPREARTVRDIPFPRRRRLHPVRRSSPCGTPRLFPRTKWVPKMLS